MHCQLFVCLLSTVAARLSIHCSFSYHKLVTITVSASIKKLELDQLADVLGLDVTRGTSLLHCLR